MINIAGKLPEVLDDASLIKRLEDFVENDKEVVMFVSEIGGYKSLLTVIKTIGAKSGRHATDVVNQLIGLDYESFRRTIELYIT